MPPRVEGKLGRYRQKRVAGATTEPMGGRAERPGLYVVQLHHASHLHYDLRLELGGVLKSWAVPKEPSLDPADKRLAVLVEDHPVEYGDFEGTIPAGNYGAGSVIVWDLGTWHALEDPVLGLETGKLLFELRGRKLRGVFTLVRTKKARDRAPSREWLLIKKPDAFARTGATLPPESVLSGRLVDEVAQGSARLAELRAELARLPAPTRAVAASDVEPMLAEPRRRPFSSPDWMFELKYDGFRLLAGRAGGAVSLYHRRGREVTTLYPEIVRALATWPGGDLVLDGEVVASDAAGRPSFQRLLARMGEGDQTAITYWAFDLLAFEGKDLRPLPFSARRALLERLVPRHGFIRLAECVPARGEDLFAATRELGLEGIVAKRAASPYRAGRHADWVKVRGERSDDLVIVGWTRGEGSRHALGALHLAWYQGERLVYAGRVGSGLDEATVRALVPRLAELERKKPAFEGLERATKVDRFCEPELVCEVRYPMRSEEGRLRMPVFVRLRDDKAPGECLDPAAREDAPLPVAPPAAPAPRTVALTNVDKVFWPDEGYTKGDVVAYYRAIAPHMLPYLADRPLVMVRYPDGITGKSFFQKDAPSWSPDWLHTARVWSGDAEREIDYFIADSADALAYLANLGAIPLHVWSSRTSLLERPDVCILDLDPKGAPFPHVVTIALEARRLCDEVGWPSYIKTSGSAGLHVLLPLGAACTHDESRQLAEVLARLVADRLPDIATVARHIPKRKGRVYLDAYQNGHGKLLVAPYSLRPLPGAPASTPLRWSEVGPRLDPRQFTLKTLPARADALAEDPLRPAFTEVPDLPAILGRLTALLGKR